MNVAQDDNAMPDFYVSRTLPQRLYDALLRLETHSILNTQAPQSPAPEARLDVALQTLAQTLKAEAIGDDSTVDYAHLSQSKTFLAYQQLTAHLPNFDLASLTTRQDKLAFWMNLYNALVLDGIVQYGIQKSVSEVSGFFRRVAYNVGGYRFCLDDIENGILRANAPQPVIPRPQFGADDARLAFTLNERDPRIHFALVCGAVSCPPIRFYEADKVDAQLDIATRNFIQQSTRYDEGTSTLTLSRILAWYACDFGAGEWLKIGIGNRRALLPALLPHLPDDVQTMLAQAKRIVFNTYDWSLNGG
jgi:hypothetical protein